MNTIFGWLGLIVIIINYLLVLKINKWFFHIGVVASVLYIIHAIITNDLTVGLVNAFMIVVCLIKILRNQNV